jgi:arsenite methyltransferase
MAITSKKKCCLPKPGGTKITERALDFCSFAPCAEVADIGCGTGETLRFAKKRYGLDITGIDIDEALKTQLHDVKYYAADAACLPFRNGAMDGLLYECSFSKMAEPDKVLLEAFRVLAPKGRIIISDFYSHSEDISFSGVLGRVEKKETIETRLSAAGFAVQLFEDYSEDMKTLWAELIWEYGTEKLYNSICTDRESLNAAKCGYALFIAEKK